MNKINESASGGATSAGAIATVPSGLNFPLQRRLPPTTLFGTADNIQQPAKEKKKKK